MTLQEAEWKEDTQEKLKKLEKQLNTTTDKLWRLRKNTRRAFRRVVIITAIAAAVYCATEASSRVSYKYHQVQSTKKFIQSKYSEQKPSGYYNIKQKFSVQFWNELSKEGYIIIGLLAALAGAACGYFGIWLVYKIIKFILLESYFEQIAPARKKT